MPIPALATAAGQAAGQVVLTQQQQIEQQRQQLEQQQTQAQLLQRQLAPTQMQLRAGALAGIQALPARAEMQRQERAVRAYGGALAGAGREFELQVAKGAPEFATPQAFAQALTEAKGQIRSHIDSLQREIVGAEAGIAQERAAIQKRLSEGRSIKGLPEAISHYNDQISELKAEMNPLKQALKSSDTELISKYYSGEVEAMSKYEQRRAESQHALAVARAETKAAASPLGSYVPGVGFVTTTGSVYPTTDPKWVPSAESVRASDILRLQEQFPSATSGQLGDIAMSLGIMKAPPGMKVPTYEQAVRPFTSSGYLESLIKKYPTLTSGEIHEIARKTAPWEFPAPKGYKPQLLAFTPSKEGWTFERIPQPIPIAPTPGVTLTPEDQAAKEFQAYQRWYDPFHLVPAFKAYEERTAGAIATKLAQWGVPETITLKTTTIPGVIEAPTIIPTTFMQREIAKFTRRTDLLGPTFPSEITITRGQLGQAGKFGLDLYLLGKGLKAAEFALKTGLEVGTKALGYAPKVATKVAAYAPALVSTGFGASIQYSGYEQKKQLDQFEKDFNKNYPKDFTRGEAYEQQRQEALNQIKLAKTVATTEMYGGALFHIPLATKLIGELNKLELIGKFKVVEGKIVPMEERGWLGLGEQQMVIGEKGAKVTEKFKITKPREDIFGVYTTPLKRLLQKVSPFEAGLSKEIMPFAYKPIVQPLAKIPASTIEGILRAIETEAGTVKLLPSVTVSQREGTKQMVIGILTGESETLTRQQIANLQPYERYVYEKAMQQYGKLAEEQQAAIAGVEYLKLGKLRLEEGRAGIEQPKVEFKSADWFKKAGEEETLGFYVKKGAKAKVPLTEGTVYIKVPEEGLLFGKETEFLIRHERGHYYIEKFGTLVELTSKQERDLFVKAKNYLLNRYSMDIDKAIKIREEQIGRKVTASEVAQFKKNSIPYPESKYIEEYLAEPTGKRKTQDVLRAYWESIPEGRRITRSLQISVTEPVKEVTVIDTLTGTKITKKAIEESPFFFTKIFAKEIKRPFPRAAGKVEVLPFITKVKPPIELGEGITTVDIIPKRVLTPRLKQTLAEARAQLIPAVPIKAIYFPKPVTLIQRAEKAIAKAITPSLITGVITIPRTITVITPGSIPTLVSSEKTVTIEVPKVIPKLMPLTRISEISIPKVSQAFITIPRVVPMVTPIEIPKLAEIPVVIPRVVPMVTPIVTPIIKPIITTIITPIVTPIVPPPEIPRLQKVPPPIIIPGKKKAAQAMLKPIKRKAAAQGFTVQVRRRKKWTPAMAISVPKEEAWALGAAAVIKSAAVTYKIIPTKKPIRPTGIKPTMLQRAVIMPGRKPGEWIQKPRLRIISRGEVKEISYVGAATRRAGSTRKASGRRNIFF
jgi:hypothetical protein